MLLSKKVYAIQCNSCDKVLEEYDWGEGAYWDEVSILETSAQDIGWMVYSGKHFCPACYYNVDENKIITNTKQND